MLAAGGAPSDLPEALKRSNDAAKAPLPVPLIVTRGVAWFPPSGSTAGSALSPTPPQGGSDTGTPCASLEITPPLRGSRRSRAARRRLMRWGGGRRAAADDSRPHRDSAGRRPITPSFCNRSSSAWLNPQSFKAARVCSPGSAGDCWIRLGVRRLPPTGSTAGSALLCNPYMVYTINRKHGLHG